MVRGEQGSRRKAVLATQLKAPTGRFSRYRTSTINLDTTPQKSKTKTENNAIYEQTEETSEEDQTEQSDKDEENDRLQHPFIYAQQKRDEIKTIKNNSMNKFRRLSLRQQVIQEADDADEESLVGGYTFDQSMVSFGKDFKNAIKSMKMDEQKRRSTLIVPQIDSKKLLEGYKKRNNSVLAIDKQENKNLEEQIFIISEEHSDNVDNSQSSLESDSSNSSIQSDQGMTHLQQKKEKPGNDQTESESKIFSNMNSCNLESSQYSEDFGLVKTLTDNVRLSVPSKLNKESTQRDNYLKLQSKIFRKSAEEYKFEKEPIYKLSHESSSCAQFGGVVSGANEIYSFDALPSYKLKNKIKRQTVMPTSQSRQFEKL